MMAPSPRPRCQLVIPCYRDAARLAPFLDKLLAGLPAEFTVQVVDDGSGAAAAAELAGVLSRARLVPRGARLAEAVMLPVNRGKGAAVRAGWAAETANVAGSAAEMTEAAGFVLAGFVDADGAVGVAEIVRGYDYLRGRLDRLDGILGSRLKVLGRRVERRFFRHFCGRVFATLVSELSGLPIYDTQCGFKLIKTAVLEPVRPRLRSDRFAFDVELILELTAAGAELREFPVDWMDQAGSKVSVPREMLPMLWDVWQASRRVRAAGRSG